MNAETSDTQPGSPQSVSLTPDEITVSLAPGHECQELTAAAGGSNSLAVR